MESTLLLKPSTQSNSGQEPPVEARTIYPQYDALVWSGRTVERVDNHPFNVSDTPYLADIFQDKSKTLVVRKASQIRISMTMVMRFLWRICCKGWNGIYYFPTDTAMYDFVKTRVNPLIDRNHKLSSLIIQTNNLTIKQIAQNFAYFFGLESKTTKESTPADCEVFDEYDLMSPKDVEIALERMQDSPHKYVDYLGNPTIPGYGTDAKFQESDQKFWCMKCPHCSKWVEADLMTDKMPFPQCIEQGFLACTYCHKPLDVKIGKWVPKHPGRETSGYALNRFICFNADYPVLFEKFKKAFSISNYYNRTIGLPYSDTQTKIEVPQILALCGDTPIMDRLLTDEKLTAGIDINPQAGHFIVISRPGKNKLREYLFMGIRDSMDDIPPLLRAFGVKKFVIDAQPDPEHVRRDVISPFQSRGWMCYYSDTQKGGPIWNEEKRIVSANRTETLDASHRLFRDGLVELPRRSEIVEEFAEHCSNIARVLEIDEETGEAKARWVELTGKPDHFRQAFNYDAMCWFTGETKIIAKPGIIKVSSSDLYKQPMKNGSIHVRW